MKLLLVVLMFALVSCRSSEEKIKDQIHQEIEQFIANQDESFWESLLEVWQKRKRAQGLYYNRLLDERKEISVDSLPAWGPVDAEVRVLAFLDIADIYSSMLFENLEVLKRRYGDTLVIYYGYNPQNNLPNSQSSAQAVWALAQQGKAWDFVRWALAEGLKARDADILTWVQSQKGVDQSRFELDRNSNAAAEAVARSQKQAHDLGTPNTPTIYFEGVALRGVQTLDHYVPMVEAAKSFRRALGEISPAPKK